MGIKGIAGLKGGCKRPRNVPFEIKAVGMESVKIICFHCGQYTYIVSLETCGLNYILTVLHFIHIFLETHNIYQLDLKFCNYSFLSINQSNHDLDKSKKKSELFTNK